MFNNLTPMVKNLLILNVGIFLIQWVLEVNFPEILGLRYIFSEKFEPYQLFTHIFIHAGGWHLFSNMFALFIFGPLLERVWGAGRFLIFFLITGLGASMLYSAVNFYEVRQLQVAAETYVAAPDPERFNTFVTEHGAYAYRQLFDFIDAYGDNPQDPALVQSSQQYALQIYEAKADIPMVGASGAVFGILMAFGMLFPNMELMLLFPPIPIKAKYFVLFYGLYELYMGFQRVAGDNVAHFAHLGGMLFAYILIKAWQGKSNQYY